MIFKCWRVAIVIAIMVDINGVYLVKRNDIVRSTIA